MKKLLSLSVAAYNIEKFIDLLMESLLVEECLDKMEIIIVNDGSTDKTLETARHYSSMYPNSVVVINKDNGGWGSTVNAALDKATGKYFKLLDGDDWFDKNTLSQFIEFLENCDEDMVLTTYTMFCEPDFKNQSVIKQPYQYNVRLPIETIDRYCMHALAVKTNLIKNKIKITEKCFYTDIEFFLKCANECSNFISIDLNVYCYRVGRGGQSISPQSLKKHYFEHEYISKECYQLVNQPKFDKLKPNVVGLCFSNYKYILLLDSTKENHVIFKNYRRYLKTIKASSKGQSLLIKILYTFPFLYWIIGPVFRKSKL